MRLSWELILLYYFPLQNYNFASYASHYIQNILSWEANKIVPDGSQQWWGFCKPLRIFFTDFWYRSNASWMFPWTYRIERGHSAVVLIYCHETIMGS